ncbi:MAG: vitamin K epoxide reductase family protein [Sandaracinaceae bacterium]
MRSTRIAVGVTIVAAALGFAFAAVSTNDFVQHLDRQVHGLHCSFLPGVDEADVTGESGCHVTLMSPYSSFLRESVWGGVPIALLAMAVFAFLFAWGCVVLLMRRDTDPRVTGFTALSWVLPVLSSVVMGTISLSTLGAACKLCIGIYAASGVGFLAALVSFALARRRRTSALPEPVDADASSTAPLPLVVRPLGWGALAGAFGAGVLFVVVPVVAYAAAAPEFERYVGSCGELADASDPQGALIPLGPQTRPVPVLEVLDPLCPACRGFENRLAASSVPAQASRRILLFPLDDTCNWMVNRAIHPGACAISEAVICADEEAEEVIAWAFENQERIVEAAGEDPDAAADMARARFPTLADCIGSPRAQAQLNASLRWAVQNELPVLTPQVYVGDARLCDADTDLGMDFALTRLVDRHRAGGEGTP